MYTYLIFDITVNKKYGDRVTYNKEVTIHTGA
jgi:hypothetical protein